MNETLAKGLLVGTGGFLGANLRYWLAGWIQAKIGGDVPWSTLAVNASGSFVAGLFLGLAAQAKWGEPWKLLVAVGLLGGFTTFSAFSVEAMRLVEQKMFGPAVLYVGGHLALCLFGAAAGLVLASSFGTGA